MAVTLPSASVRDLFTPYPGAVMLLMNDMLVTHAWKNDGGFDCVDPVLERRPCVRQNPRPVTNQRRALRLKVNRYSYGGTRDAWASLYPRYTARDRSSISRFTHTFILSQ